MMLEQQMQAIAAENGFHAVSIGFNSKLSGRQWTANVHWDGFSRDGIACKHGQGDTPYKALEVASENAASDREPYGDEGEKARRIERLREQLAELTGEAA